MTEKPFSDKKNEQEKHNETVVAHVTADGSLQPMGWKT